ncbi:hypothetical protein K0U83_03660 [bacterium]|nr:hypothetical protein [bacterium]
MKDIHLTRHAIQRIGSRFGHLSGELLTRAYQLLSAGRFDIRKGYRVVDLWIVDRKARVVFDLGGRVIVTACWRGSMSDWTRSEIQKFLDQLPAVE